MDSTDVSWFVKELKAVRKHYINERGWEDLRAGTYLGGQTASQIRKRGFGGPGLVCPILPQDQWGEAWSAITALHRQRQTDENLDAIERERREIHIDKFLETALPTANEQELEEAGWLVDSYASRDEWAALEKLLQDARKVGWTVAKGRRNGATKVVLAGYAFWILEAIAELLVAYGAFHAVESRFEKIVICLLLLSYARLAERTNQIDIQQRFGSAEIQKQFLRVGQLLRDRPSRFWRTDEWAFKNRLKLEQSNVRVLISAFKYSAVAFLAGCGLIWTVL